MDNTLSNNPPLIDLLELGHEALRDEIRTALGNMVVHPIERHVDLEAARARVKPLKELQDRVEAARKAAKAPFLAGSRTVDEFFTETRLNLDRLVDSITRLASAYQARKREEAQKIERVKARIAEAVGEA